MVVFICLNCALVHRIGSLSDVVTCGCGMILSIDTANLDYD
ncbi:MAG: hypothetical protein ABIH63_04230 [archaeon]